MTPGRRVRIGGKARTIPTARVARYEQVEAEAAALYPGADHAHERTAALDAAGLYLRGELDAATAGTALRAARDNLDAAVAAARAVAVLAVDDATISEASAARAIGVDRLTIRKWRGKQDRR
jgi:hypothetical protein